VKIFFLKFFYSNIQRWNLLNWK